MNRQLSFPKTKIIATVGPAIGTKTQLSKIIKAGTNIFRINFSHGTYRDYERYIKWIREASKETMKPVEIMCDFQGPKLRIGAFEKLGGVILKRNQEFVITSKKVLGTDAFVSGPFPVFYTYVKKNQDIYLNDGLIHLKVKKILGKEVVCKVIEGGTLSDHKGINLPWSLKTFPIPTEKDKRDIKFAIKNKLSTFAFSFVQTPDDVRGIRSYLKRFNWDGMLISKIEKPKAIDNLDEIISLSDGLLVARGDLGVELALENVPSLQKQMIDKCNQRGKLVITATQMLETMVSNMVPTRAEVSDVANAVFDGTDVVMLSGETASGKYPIQAVKMMRKIVLDAEQHHEYRTFDAGDPRRDVAHVITSSAVHAAQFINARVIVCHTESGQTAFRLSKFHPRRPIIAFTPNIQSFYRMSLFYGVLPIFMKRVPTTEKMINMGDTELLKRNICRSGEKVVVVAGEVQAMGATNMIKIHTL